MLCRGVELCKGLFTCSKRSLGRQIQIQIALVPGETMYIGLMFLSDDGSVLKMDKAMVNGGFADIFVEELENQDWEESEAEEL